MEEKIIIYYYQNKRSSSVDHKTSIELRHIAASLYTGFPVDYPIDACGKFGKPYFSNLPDVHFSVSHSSNIWICAFSKRPIGCDIERHPEKIERLPALSKRWFSEPEQIYVAEHGCTPRAFAQIWVRKEAYVKLIGCGIDSRFPNFSALDMCDIRDFVIPGYENKPFSSAVAIKNANDSALLIDFLELFA